MNFPQKIASYIADNQLPESGAKLIVGVSGGADSVALLHVLLQLHYSCVVAHCNFHLRGNESDEDVQFVGQLCEKWNIPFETIDFDTKNKAKERGISIEMAARDLRYAWFEALRQRHQAVAVAIAHHLDDSIETFFINLARGTGLRGLVGIQALQGNIIRPLLDITRGEIENYLNSNNIPFRTDSTNFDQSILRNKIRHTVIPTFEAINPAFLTTMRENFDRLAETLAVANGQVDKLKDELVESSSDQISIDIDLLQAHENIHFCLFELLRPYNFGAATINDIITQLNGDPGKQFFSPTHRLIKDRSRLIIHPLTETDTTHYIIDAHTRLIDYPLSLSISAPQARDRVIIEREKEFAFLDTDKLIFPLLLRHPKAGDFFYPFGSKGKKKLSDYFIDQKWNLYQKEQCWLILSDDQIVWVVGNRIDNRFCINAGTKRVTKIRFLQPVV
jgi:tRNA(Ile)-lysidine synthase